MQVKFTEDKQNVYNSTNIEEHMLSINFKNKSQIYIFNFLARSWIYRILSLRVYCTNGNKNNQNRCLVIFLARTLTLKDNVTN